MWFLAWIRRKVAEAVLLGVADACEQMDRGDEVPALELPAVLRERLALPAAGGEEKVNGKKARAAS